MKHTRPIGFSVLAVLAAIVLLLPDAPRALANGGTWEEITSATSPPARYAHTLTNVNGTVYLFGGVSTAGSSPAGRMLLGVVFNDVWKYNLDNSDFEEVIPGTSTEARYYHAATAAEHMLWVFFGVGASSNVLSDIVTYDPAMNRWMPQPASGDAPGGRLGHTAVTIGSNIYIFGGNDNSFSLVTPEVWKYAIGTRTWEKIGYTYPNAPCPRNGHVAAVIQGKMIVWGGFGGWGGSGSLTYLNDMWAFDPLTKQWSQVTIQGTTPPPLSTAGAAWYSNTLWTFGGETYGGQPVDAVMRFTWRDTVDITTNTPAASLPSPRGCPTGTPFSFESLDAVIRREVGGNAARPSTTQVKVLLFGGRRNGQAVAEPLVLTYTVETPTNTPTPPIRPVGGYVAPVNRLELLAPWLGLVALMAVAVAVAVAIRRRVA